MSRFPAKKLDYFEGSLPVQRTKNRGEAVRSGAKNTGIASAYSFLKRDMAYPLSLIPSNGSGIVPVFKLSNEPSIGYGNYRCLDPAMADTTIVVRECLPNSYLFHKGPPEPSANVLRSLNRRPAISEKRKAYVDILLLFA